MRMLKREHKWVSSFKMNHTLFHLKETFVCHMNKCKQKVKRTKMHKNYILNIFCKRCLLVKSCLRKVEQQQLQAQNEVMYLMDGWKLLNLLLQTLLFHGFLRFLFFCIISYILGVQKHRLFNKLLSQKRANLTRKKRRRL